MSLHFDGKRFYNQSPQAQSRRVIDILRWLSSRKPKKWPVKPTKQSNKVLKQPLNKDEIVSTFINHSTVLIQFEGLNILTDPIWSNRCSPVKWTGPKRVVAPGIAFDDLPSIDIVLISHNHYDHMDLPTLKRLFKKFRPLFYVSKGNKKLLESKGLQKVTELDWWESIDLFETLQLTFVPAQHFSNRGIFDRDKSLWGGFVLKGAKKGPIYFAGDTGYCAHFKQIKEVFGPIQLAFLPIGSYQPQWLMSPVHMSPEEAVKAHIELESNMSIAIHFGTFQLGDEAYEDPIKDLKKALISSTVSEEQFLILEPGESQIVPAFFEDKSD